MKFVPSFLSAATQHLCRAEAQAGPVVPSTTTARTYPITSIETAPKAPEIKDTTMPKLFTPSPFACTNGLPPEEITSLSVVFSNQDVLFAAGALRTARARLTDYASYRSGISEAIEIAGHDAPAVVEALHRLADDAEEALEAARADHSAHDSVVKAQQKILLPLALAVGRLSSEKAVERSMLENHITAAKSCHADAASSTARYTNLKAAGLTDTQIVSLGIQSPSVTLQELRDRAVEVDRILEQCAAFSADPYKSGSHLKGLGFDELIEAQRMATDGFTA